MISGIASLYHWRYPRRLLQLFAANNYHVWAFLNQYWQTRQFVDTPSARRVPKLAIWLLGLGMLAQLALAGLFIYRWQQGQMYTGLAFGAAMIIGYPVVWAYIVTLPVLLRRLLQPKMLGKAFITKALTGQVIRLRKRRKFTVIAVNGSLGKTSTKIAIAKLLAASSRVRWQEGNYNDPVTVPLIFFGHPEPAILNVVAWCKILLQNERALRRPYPYDYVVVELGTDAPGTMPVFAYIQPELAVVTAVAPEHMAFFKTLDGVAEEELAVFSYAKKVLVNVDETPAKYLKGKEYIAYGLTDKAAYHIMDRKHKGLEGQKVTFKLAETHALQASIPLLGDQGATIALAAVASAHVLGVAPNSIANGVAAIAAFAGRMQVLAGIKNSTLIDDTYNSSPPAAKAALDVLYSGDAPQRIAILGSMNEMGEYSPEAHKQVGNHCDPKKLDLVVTIGQEANDYLAPVAKRKGCTVQTFTSPHDAGEYVKQHLKEGAVVLAKGSQNGVFAEEALKPLLADAEHTRKLVRQSDYWLGVKAKQFGHKR